MGLYWNMNVLNVRGMVHGIILTGKKMNKWDFTQQDDDDSWIQQQMSEEQEQWLLDQKREMTLQMFKDMIELQKAKE